ncbi:MAG: methyltransferase domain-containing protein [Pseudomonadota bacterium]
MFAKHGITDEQYLHIHYGRYAATLSEFLESRPASAGCRLLDVGAHWLHQALLWKLAGFEVTAVDLPENFEHSSIVSLAEREHITLHPVPDLSATDALAGIADSSVDVVLFAEILEHLTFNPVDFWAEVHRVLSPEGRVVVTTPNYYALRGRAWGFSRFARGLGGGIPVHEILTLPTYGHHWKEFSRREIIMMFCLLSPDWVTVKAKYMRNYFPERRPKRPAARAVRAIEHWVPALRPNLHLEIALTEKTTATAISPSWHGVA